MTRLEKNTLRRLLAIVAAYAAVIIGAGRLRPAAGFLLAGVLYIREMRVDDVGRDPAKYEVDDDG